MHLMSRAYRGVYTYFRDKETEQHFRSALPELGNFRLTRPAYGQASGSCARTSSAQSSQMNSSEIVHCNSQQGNTPLHLEQR